MASSLWVGFSITFEDSDEWKPYLDALKLWFAGTRGAFDDRGSTIDPAQADELMHGPLRDNLAFGLAETHRRFADHAEESRHGAEVRRFWSPVCFAGALVAAVVWFVGRRRSKAARARLTATQLSSSNDELDEARLELAWQREFDRSLAEDER